MTEQIGNWLQSNGFGAINRLEPVGGGCINNTTRIHLEDGSSVFLKQQDSPSDKEFYPIYVHSCPRCRTPIKSGSNLSLKNTFQNLIFQQETGKIGKIFLFSGRNPEIGDLQKNDPRLAGASASRGSNSTLSAIGIT